MSGQCVPFVALCCSVTGSVWLLNTYLTLETARGVTVLKKAGGTGGFFVTETGLAVCAGQSDNSPTSIPERRCFRIPSLVYIVLLLTRQFIPFLTWLRWFHALWYLGSLIPTCLINLVLRKAYSF